MRAFRTPTAPGRRSPRRGVSAVEFALVAPFLVTLVLGMIELARAFQVKEFLSDSAQRAARVGSLPGKSNADIQAAVADVMADNHITGYSVTVLVNGASADASTARRNDQVSVKVAVPTSRVYWISTLFVTAQMQESETVVMLRQG
jgi:Flp pilus assembly protein TadG